MASYVISDIHGEYDLFEDLLDLIGLKDEDTLYILGDVLDRGPNPIKAMLRIMDMPNAVFIAGNHEAMSLGSLPFLCREYTNKMVQMIDVETVFSVIEWMQNGASPTIEEFKDLPISERKRIVDYIQNAKLYVETEAGGYKYLLVHSGLGNFSPDKRMEDYTVDDLVWERADYDTQYFDDVFVVSGHTPTQAIPQCEEGGYIFRKNNHIAIDCGACFAGGRLAAFCLDTQEEFYSCDNNEPELLYY